MGSPHIQGVVISGNADQDVSIQVKHERNSVFLLCKLKPGESVTYWRKDGIEVRNSNDSQLLVGSAVEDHRGLYQCYTHLKRTGSLQLHFRMCQYCVQLNSATVMGMVAAEVLATAFLVVAVCTLAAQEPSRRSRASDKQNLLAHDQLYQPLGERNNGQYSHIGVAKARHR
ncbi:T-cell surface glycoprotein CD3 gamma chain-like isoform X2 [Eublepharis macularius]|uniref:T-cell surface glycoprotein CD3 gamma chain-like isoform X2 n=1 Tax=Eublepharis macularius TaxID=481883 RepID=A0AA97LFT5_EUBMA|nr:T-cell surface glycoprotein CD3 gamma chain-like isoform X2 [Eublepharis macularius]